MNRLLLVTTMIAFLIAASGCDDIPDPSLPNEPPVAMDDSVLLLQNATVVINVLANDIDIDGDPLEITIIEEPVNGTLENNSGILTYTPSLYLIGEDEFVYQITDLVGHTSTATVTLEIAKRHSRAVFSTENGGVLSIYTIDSRDPATLIDLTQAVPAEQDILAWEISELQQQVLVLTDDSDGVARVLGIAFDTPAEIASEFTIDTTSGAPDGGLVVSDSGDIAVVSLANRYLIAINIIDGRITEFDTGLTEDSTLSPQFFAAQSNTAAIAGTLGSDADERGAIYTVALPAGSPQAVLDEPGNLGLPFTRLLTGLGSMLWLTIDDSDPVPSGAYSCTAPPPQVYSAPFYSLLNSTDAAADLIEASGILAAPVSVISYHGSEPGGSLVLAACPASEELFQIVRVPYLLPSAAAVLATAEDASDGLWNLDVANTGSQIIYSVDGDSGFRVVSLDLSGDDPVAADLSDTVSSYQAYTAGMATRVPPSVFSTDQLRWLYLVPQGDALTGLAWLQLESEELSTVDLPFAAANLVSDGFYAVVQGSTGSPDAAPIAVIDLAQPVVTPVEIPGVVAESISDPLNQFKSAIRLINSP
ncbi:MAG: cadherin-like domain-containing protein [Gammaproteobacteria bacterium]|nr:cadherin-like domain-containing protein [Gammaproteobacteria bacterium]NNM20524.1 Ig-like domain-containing protein [Gammaproteobacteria bacterium]